MKLQFLLTLFSISSLFSVAQEGGYKFSEIIKVPTTSVKDQASTGTCWCFATTSFFESELLRKGKEETDLSEMFIVRQKYLNQLENNFLRQGKGNIGQGSLSHTYTNAFKQVGIVPEEVYKGISYNSQKHNHTEMVSFMESIAKTAIANGVRSDEYYKLINNLFDTYLGELPEKFTYNGKEYTPKSYAASLELNMDDYVELTSFTHKPYYQEMEIVVPDNWEHERSFNVPLNELISVMDNALNNGYSICWDGDVSERGFSFRNGVAINPDLQKSEDLSQTDRARFEKLNTEDKWGEILKFKAPVGEINVTPEIRQQGYETFVTTDDHLMHIVGIAKDQNDNKYYITKNSWGAGSNSFGGYLNMSESYVKAKTIYIMLHKDALPKDLKQKIGLK
ncbi:MAG: C1 family peptidase [Bacteroidales bacterium]|nr:C1 family peptidase [Bacteroidales bacterium]